MVSDTAAAGLISKNAKARKSPDDLEQGAVMSTCLTGLKLNPLNSVSVQVYRASTKTVPLILTLNTCFRFRP